MKLWKYILSVMIVACSLQGFAQSSTGELDRFKNESLVRINEVKVFPNPSVDILNVQIENSNIGQVKIVVHNIIGNVVNVDIEALTETQFRIKVKDLPPGYYLVSISDQEKITGDPDVATMRFVKR